MIPILRFHCAALFLVAALSSPATATEHAPSESSGPDDGTARTARPAHEHAALTPDGAWCWFADPRAISRDNRTYTGWVTADGSIQAAMLDHHSGDVTVVNLHEQYERDDHDNPAFLFLADGRLMAFYSKHCGPEMNARVTKRPGDISEWEAERSLDLYGAEPRPARNITYPNPVMLPAENNDILLFWRGDTWKPTFSRSTDGGATWSPGKVIVSRPGADGDNRPYVKIASNGSDRVHIIFTDGHPRNETLNSVYYACYRDGAFHKADGTRIATESELPFTPEQADKVYDASLTGVRAWIWDVAAEDKDRPVIAYTRLPAEGDHRYHFARWDGVQWTDAEICHGGKWFPQTRPNRMEKEPHYSGGIALNQTDPSILHLSRPVNGIFEIERWQTSDGGKSWISEPVTANSSADNVRPFAVRDAAGNGPSVLWMHLLVHYIHYTDYRTSILADHPRGTLLHLPGKAPVASPAPAPPPLSTELRKQPIMTAMRRVADWQLEHPSRHPPTDWTQAAGYTGFMALHQLCSDTKYRDAMIAMGEGNQWKLGGRAYHADDHAVGQTYCELFFETRDSNMIAPMRAAFDRILAQPVHVDSLEFAGEGDVWSWCDALFMAPPAWLRLWKATGDERYREFAVTNWWRTSDYLYDTEEHLFFRDSTFFNKREANGRKTFWSRGNGWVIAGLVRMLQHLPQDDPDRPRFEKQFREMAAALLACQQEDGLWRSSLLNADDYPLKESSGSGFHTYGLAWGINNGYLDRATFEPAVRKAWTALIGCVGPEGKLTHVQPIGADPRRFNPTSTEIYGVGAFLLAGSEVYRLAPDADD